MSKESGNKSFIKSALEIGVWPFNLTKKAGELALTTAEEVYTGKPAAGEPHISERLQTEIVVNEALVGKQMVEIADLTDPSRAESSSEERELQSKRRGYNVYGHSKIVKALLQADSDPQVDHHQAQQVINIAKEAGTDPARLDAVFSEHELQQAKRIIEP
jgi:hypothetical protein